MRVNSWLYHYYTVQSKLQYGLAYEPHAATQVTRMGNNNNNTSYYQHPQSMSPYQQENSVYHHHPHHHPQVSPSPHHHQPIPQPLSHPEAFRYSGRRSEPEPVDYSVHSEPDLKVKNPMLPMFTGLQKLIIILTQSYNICFHLGHRWSILPGRLQLLWTWTEEGEGVAGLCLCLPPSR